VITNCWEPGTKCTVCLTEFGFGEEMVHGRHLACNRGRADTRDGEEDVLDVARAKLATPGRLTFTSRQLRRLIELSALQPVRKPDAGLRLPLYGKMPGWSAKRVSAGLPPAEIAGLWLDFLDVGKVPPVKHEWVAAILAAIDGRPAIQVQAAG
jgi:hypothetical protein